MDTQGYYDQDLVSKIKKAERDEKLAALQEKRVSLMETHNIAVKELENAKSENKKIIYLEVCFDCESHRWCTQHDQSKYDKFVSLLKAEVTKECGSEWFVSVNSASKVKIGSFEIMYDDKVVFSKNERKIWPHIPTVVGKIKNTEEFEKS